MAKEIIIYHLNLLVEKKGVLDSGSRVTDVFAGCAKNDLCDLECIDCSLLVP